jgi:hypothetical protein
MRYPTFLLVVAISLLCNVRRTDAQKVSCINFWVNPNTGQEECLNSTMVSPDHYINGRIDPSLTVVQKSRQSCQRSCLYVAPAHAQSTNNGLSRTQTTQTYAVPSNNVQARRATTSNRQITQRSRK